MEEERTSYHGFAEVYDLFMNDIPYDEWAKYLIELLGDDHIESGLVLELGCGTGEMTERLAQAGYDMIGVDASEEMLEVAMEKCRESKSDILYLLQDMREFELYGTVRAVVSICDSMNYITNEEDLQEVFRLVNNYLDPGGLFIFDMKTAYYFREVMGDCTMTDQREEGSLIWENSWFEEEKINQYELTLFLKEANDLYRKQEETHFQKAYSLDCLKNRIEAAGMEFVAAYDALTKEPAREDSERIYVLAREKGK